MWVVSEQLTCCIQSLASARMEGRFAFPRHAQGLPFSCFQWPNTPFLRKRRSAEEIKMFVLMSSLRSQCCLLFPYLLFAFLIFKVLVMTRLLGSLLKLFGKFLLMSTVDGSRSSHLWVPVLPAPVYLPGRLILSHRVPQLGSEFRVLSLKKKSSYFYTVFPQEQLVSLSIFFCQTIRALRERDPGLIRAEGDGKVREPQHFRVPKRWKLETH